MIKLGRALTTAGLPWINQEDRFRHLYLVGKTRTGKSTFFLNLVNQDIPQGGVIVLDPAGSFADSVSAIAPPERLIEISKFSPRCINPLRRDISWAEQAKEFTEVMNACISATTSSPESTVLMEEILLQAFRVLKDRDIEGLASFLNFWQVRKDLVPNDKYWKFFDSRDSKNWLINKEKVDSAKRVGSRLTAFYIDPLIRKFTIGKDQFNVKKFVDQQKIVVVNLNGLDDNSKIYIGNLITHAVKSYYQHQATEQSPPLYFYIDEFHSFISPFWAEMLSQCAKYNISVNLAHQHQMQIDKLTLSSILGNCYTRVVFQCGYDEAFRMSNELSCTPKELMSLGKYEALIGIGKNNHLVKTNPPPKVEKKEYYFLSNDWITT